VADCCEYGYEPSGLRKGYLLTASQDRLCSVDLLIGWLVGRSVGGSVGLLVGWD
jgi:hypothetical protein